MTKAQAAERQEAIAQLRKWIKPGDTVYTILDHVSRSGMSRHIRIVVPMRQKRRHGLEFVHPNYAVGRVLGLRHAKRQGREQDALVVGGGYGMDMGLHVVCKLSATIYPKYKCLGQGKCPSNYHVNYRRMIRCPGVGDRFCWRPDAHTVRTDPHYKNWPTEYMPIPGDHPDDAPGHLRRILACLTGSDDGGKAPEGCPTCQGAGELPNPEGPERWDLVHTGGYALRHRWL